MKKLLAIALLTITSLVALPQTATAGPSHSITYKSGHTACGCSIYTKRIIVGWDSCRRPIYRYIALPVAHHCGHGHHTVLRTSSCGPRIISSHRSWSTSSWGHCRPVVPSHCHSRPLIRIRTHCR